MKQRIKIFVEGGKKESKKTKKDSKGECRQAFETFFTHAGINMKYIRVIGMGSCERAYKYFKEENNKFNNNPILLVDSNKKISSAFQSGEDLRNWKPWKHLETSHKWKKPNNANDSQCHLMVRCMETWLIADLQAVEEHFSASIHSKDLKKFDSNIEQLGCPKKALDRIADKYQNGTTKYSEVEDGFKLLSKIDPKKLIKKSPWARRLIEELKQRVQDLQKHEATE